MGLGRIAAGIALLILSLVGIRCAGELIHRGDDALRRWHREEASV